MCKLHIVVQVAVSKWRGQFSAIIDMLFLIGSLIVLGDLYDLNRDHVNHGASTGLLFPIPPLASHIYRVGHMIQSKTITVALSAGHRD